MTPDLNILNTFRPHLSSPNTKLRTIGKCVLSVLTTPIDGVDKPKLHGKLTYCFLRPSTKNPTQ